MDDDGSHRDEVCAEDWSEDTRMKSKMTKQGLSNRFIDARHGPEEAITCVIAKHNRGRAADLLEEMAKNNEAGWSQYGARGTYHIVNVDKAVDFVEDSPHELPWKFRN